jgi:hypothetical protein
VNLALRSSQKTQVFDAFSSRRYFEEFENAGERNKLFSIQFVHQPEEPAILQGPVDRTSSLLQDFEKRIERAYSDKWSVFHHAQPFLDFSAAIAGGRWERAERKAVG